MPRLLVYSDLDRNPVALLKELAGCEDLAFTFTSDPEVLATALGQRNHEVCLLLIHGEPSPGLFALLSKARGAHQLGAACSLHAAATPAGIRAMLLLGVEEVFTEPIGPKRVIQALRHRLRGAPGPLVPPGRLEEIPPAEVHLHSFGRVARIAVHRPGEIFVECGLVLPSGARLHLGGALAAWFGRDELPFRVTARDERDLYYAYPHGYWLRAAEQPVLAGWAEMLAHFRPDFVLPKPRVLWVGERRLAEVERWLSPARVSLRLVRPADVDAALLARLDPFVVVLDTPADTPDALAHWAQTHPAARLVRTERAADARWDTIPLDPAHFAPAWEARVPLPTPDPDPAVLHPGRGAALSRCAFVAPATLRALSAGGFELSCALGLGEGSLVELTGETVGDWGGTGLFGRVSSTRPAEEPDAERIRCEILPVSDLPNPALVRAARVGPADGPERVGPPRLPAPPTRRSLPIASLAAAVAAAAGLLGITWLLLHPGPPPVGGDPAGTQEVLAAIRKAFD